MTGAVDPNSVAQRVARFFRDNPDEELTYADLAVKFPEVALGTLRDIVKKLSARGEVESVHVIRNPAKGRMQEVGSGSDAARGQGA